MIHIGGVVLYCWGGGSGEGEGEENNDTHWGCGTVLLGGGGGEGEGEENNDTHWECGTVLLGGGEGGGAKQAMQRAPVSTSKQSIFCVLSACNINMFCALAAQW